MIAKKSFSQIFTTQPLQFDEFSKVNSRSICELTKYHFVGALHYMLTEFEGHLQN